MANKKNSKPAPAGSWSNPEASKAANERAFSGAWGTHADKREKRARTRSASKTRALHDYR